jgi:hypothetical protein
MSIKLKYQWSYWTTSKGSVSVFILWKICAYVTCLRNTNHETRCFDKDYTSSIIEFPEHSIPTKLTRPNINHFACFDFLSQFHLHGDSRSFVTFSVIEFQEHSIPTKQTRPNINHLTCFDFLSQFHPHGVSTSCVTSSVIEFPEHSIRNKLTSPNRPFKMFRLSFPIPSSRCFNKLCYFPRHWIPRT